MSNFLLNKRHQTITHSTGIWKQCNLIESCEDYERRFFKVIM
jgi:hypothetical protein